MTSAHPATPGRKIRVLIVDDSATVRQVMREIISGDPGLEVMAAAGDPYSAAEYIRREVPDVIFLDIEMPRMDGLTFLRKIMGQKPIPVVICSTLTEQGSSAFLEALEAGAVDVICKPRVATAQGLKDAQIRICDIARSAAQARLGRRVLQTAAVRIEKKNTADVIIPPLPVRSKAIDGLDRIVCIGASTGGTEALRKVLTALPASAPPILVVQHMPERFTNAFARRLDGLCNVRVKEAEDGEPVLPGQVLIAPGSHHILVERVGRHYRVRTHDGPLVSRHRPSVDVLFRSAAQNAGSNAAGILLTGMGDDGAQGLLEMRQAGALTIAQDETSCIVFGMPREAIERGAAQNVLPLDRMAQAIMGGAGTSTARCA